jgi:hypothetical protein
MDILKSEEYFGDFKCETRGDSNYCRGCGENNVKLYSFYDFDDWVEFFFQYVGGVLVSFEAN